MPCFPACSEAMASLRRMRNRPLFNPRRLVLRALLGVTAVQLPLAALAGFNFFTSEYTVSLDDLQKQIARRFPVQQRYAEIFTVGLSDPQMSFDPAANRATITARLSIRNPLFNPQVVDGIVAISSALRYDAPTRSLRLDLPKTERLELQGLSGGDADRLQKSAGWWRRSCCATTRCAPLPPRS